MPSHFRRHTAEHGGGAGRALGIRTWGVLGSRSGVAREHRPVRDRRQRGAVLADRGTPSLTIAALAERASRAIGRRAVDLGIELGPPAPPPERS